MDTQYMMSGPFRKHQTTIPSLEIKTTRGLLGESQQAASDCTNNEHRRDENPASRKAKVPAEPAQLHRCPKCSAPTFNLVVTVGEVLLA